MSKEYKKYMASKSEYVRSIDSRALQWNANSTDRYWPSVTHTEITGSDDVAYMMPDTTPLCTPPVDLLEQFQEFLDSAMETYPELHSSQSKIERVFQEQQFEQYQLFIEKNKYYGMNNISGGDDVDMTSHKHIVESLEGLYYRMRDKLQRVKNLLDTDSNGSKDESLVDSLYDLANYANIACIVKKGQWLKG